MELLEQLLEGGLVGIFLTFLVFGALFSISESTYSVESLVSNQIDLNVARKRPDLPSYYRMSFEEVVSVLLLFYSGKAPKSYYEVYEYHPGMAPEKFIKRNGIEVRR